MTNIKATKIKPKKRKHQDFKEFLLKKLQDPELALAYLNEACADEDPRIFLVALKNVLEAHNGDMTAIAAAAQLSRQSLYRILSEKGNPRVGNLRSVLHVLGLEIAVQPARNR